MNKLFITFLGLFLSGFISAQQINLQKFGEKAEITVSKEKFHLYLLIGQSNMAGRGIVEPQDTIGNPRILRLNSVGEWEIAKEPLHFDKSSAGVGPGLAFAREMLVDSNPDVVIGLIPSAVGGTSIDFWATGNYLPKTEQCPYDDALSRTKLAMKDGTLKGILWHQGESDSNPEKAATYKDKLASLATTLRNDLQMLDVPFIAGELAGFWEKGAILNPIFHEAKKDIPHYDVVSGKGLIALPDNLHIDAASQREFGKRYADTMKSLNSK
jgi:hypothetical protein